MVADFEAESITRLSSDQCARLGALRSAWPPFARFEARAPIGGAPPEVNFVRRSSVECHVRAILVVPTQKASKLTAESCLSLRNQDAASAFVLQGPDGSFNHGNATVLANRTVAGPNSFTPTPRPERLAAEGFVLVADQIIGRSTSASNAAFQKPANGSRVRLLWESDDGYQATRV